VRQGGRIDVRRQNGDPARNAVKLDQRQTARELAGRGDENRAPGKLGEPAVEAGSLIEIANAYGVARS